MNIPSSPKIAFVFSFFLFLLSFIGFFFLTDLLHAFLFSAPIFLISFFLAWYISEKIIFEKILLAVKHYRHLQNGKNKRSPDDNQTLENILSELEGWATDRKNEIERLKKLELYRKEYIGNISHELKTPVFSIQGYVLTLLDGGALEDKTVNRNYLIRTQKSVERMISIVEDLDSISQLETGNLELEPEQFDIVALIKEVFEANEMIATTKGIVYSLKSTDDDPVWVIADKFRIRQVLTNLIVNSVKYGKEYGQTIVKLINRTENISIEISDNGIGIAQEHIPRLFERFYRVDKSRSRDQGGTGLGLSIVKHIIEAHNQTISVQSKPGEGSTFSFTLKNATGK